MNSEKEELHQRITELTAELSRLRQVNADLSAEKKILDEVLDSLPGTFYIWDDRPRLVRWNKKHEEITEYSSGEYPNMLPTDFFDEKEHKSINQAIERVFSEGETALEATLITKSGKRIPHLYVATQIKINEKTFLLGFGLDIRNRVAVEQKLRKALREVALLRKQLESDYTYLNEEISSIHDYKHMIGESDAFKYVLYNINKVAPTDTTVLILGESGTGKELIARAIHQNSKRKERPLVKVDCSALPENLIESELFGHEKGAFTGAEKRRVGRFEIANGATIFLDEIGELPLELQKKLLRVIQDGEFERLGSSQLCRTDMRIIAATNRDLEEEVRRGRFREDLWYRLNVCSLSIPPLRERTEDIPLLVKFILEKVQRRIGKRIEKIPAEVMATMTAYSWPGNIRELENIIERATIFSSGNVLQLAKPLQMKANEHPVQERVQIKTLSQMEKEHILQALEKSEWNISGKDGAAELLGLNPSTLRGRMRKHGIRRSLDAHRPLPRRI